MAPISRAANGVANGTKRSKHSASQRPAKRPRKLDSAEQANPAIVTAERPRKPERPAKVSVLKDEERAFPRGGASVLTPLEHKQIQIEATRDVLFEQAGQKRAAAAGDSEDENVKATAAPKRIVKKHKKDKDRRGEVETKPEEARVKIEGLSYKALAPGSVVLGKISQISSRDVSLALPNNLTGFIPITAISDQLNKRVEKLLEDDASASAAETSSDEDDIDLSKLFSLGQYLRAYVTSTSDESPDGLSKTKRRIELSVNPRLANSGLQKPDVVQNNTVQASVVSVEDHGLILDLGLEDTSLKGFMSSNELGPNVDHTNVQEGTVFLCMVTGLNANGKIIKLSTHEQKIGSLKKTNFLTEAPTIDAFLPGTAVEMLVSDVSSSGLVGKIMGSLDATADLVHSGAGESAQDITEKYKSGAKVKARVICTFPKSDTRRVGVSLLDHVTSLSTRMAVRSKTRKDPLQELPLSSIVEEAQIFKVEAGKGLFLDLGIKGVPGFAHISRISDRKIETLSSIEGPYREGTQHRARVIGYNWMDGLFILSLEPKVLDQAFLRVEDLSIGGVVKGKIEKLIITGQGAAGLLVSVSEGISGLVPEMHMADVHLQHPERKFKEGMTVTARVLSTDPEKRQFRLTLKKSLVNSEADVWSDYGRISTGSQSPGTIINIISSGAVVQFYGSVRGFMPIAEMSESFVEDPHQHFRIGQSVTVHALSVDSEEERLLVSCKDPSAFGSDQQAAYESLQIGAIVGGNVTEKSLDTVTLDLEKSGLKAILKVGQLTDGSEQKNASAMKRVRVGQRLSDLVVLDKMNKRPLVILSNKPSLVKAGQSGTLVKSFQDLRRGQEVSGFVRNVTSEGIFVQFACGLVGLLPRSLVAEEVLKVPDFGLRRDQSISAKIFVVDHDQNRFLLSMKDIPTLPVKTSDQAPATATDDSLINSVDGMSTSITDFVAGKLTKAIITSVKTTQLNARLADNVQGRIDASEIFESWEDVQDRKHPLQKFKAKDVIDVRVIGIHDARNHRFLPISHRAGKVPVFELSAKVHDRSKPGAEPLTLDQVMPGSSWVAIVNNIHEDCIWLNLSPNVRGRISILELASDFSQLEKAADIYPIGSAVQVWVKKVNVSENRLDLSLKPNSESPFMTLDSITKGMVLPGRITKVTERNVMVQLSDTLSGPVPLTELADDFSQADPSSHSKNEILRVAVVDVDAPNKKLILSARPSKVLSSSLPVKDPSIASISQLKVNDVHRGFVKNVADVGLFVSLSHHVTAFIRISDLSDAFIKDWRAAFQVDQLVTGKIIAVDPDINHVQMSLKATVIESDYAPPVAFEDLQAGQVVTGKVRKVVDYGVFVVVDNSHNVSGLCHRSQIADEKIDDVSKLYEEGDAVKAMVLKVQPDKKRISFGLKASYFEDDMSGSESSDEDMDDGGIVVEKESSDDEEETDEDVDLEDVKDIASDASSDASNDDMSVDDEKPLLPANGLATVGFDWSGENMGLDDEDDSAAIKHEEEEPTKKKKRRKPEIKIDKTGDLDKHGPRSVADFERQLLSQPSSSSLWIQYMAFQLQLNEVEKARAIAERALRTIHMRDEEEKMNVWIAWLNLENAFGSDASVEAVFKRACQYTDVREMHERLASIYIDSGKHEQADALFHAMAKNRAINPAVAFWHNYATFLLTTLHAPARARALPARATQSVPADQHRALTASLASLEFRSPNGDAERGRTVFESLLAAPDAGRRHRAGLWDQYVDLETAHGEQPASVRALFERMAGEKMGKRRARFVFKRWLAWEGTQGDAAAAERVKARAREYVEKVKGEEEEV